MWFRLVGVRKEESHVLSERASGADGLMMTMTRRPFRHSDDEGSRHDRRDSQLEPRTWCFIQRGCGFKKSDNQEQLRHRTDTFILSEFI